MFGYIRTDTPELLVRENEYYKAVYCGLCRAQGKCTGQCSRMTLSYDIAFLALMRLAISDELPQIKKGRCLAHPLRKRPYIANCSALNYCADAAALLVYGKTVDDINDERGGKRLKAGMALPFAKSSRKKAIARAPELDAKIMAGLSRLREIEAQGLASVDIPANCFGDILADVFSFGIDGNEEKILRKIGWHIGRWIYILDAADDLSADFEKERFNPFLLLYGNGELTKEQKIDISTSLKLELLAAEPIFDLIDYKNTNTEGIIKNIIYRGMPNTAEKTLGIKAKCDKHAD
jgi:hypothetical protein